jgi:hypothetical protein
MTLETYGWTEETFNDRHGHRGIDLWTYSQRLRSVNQFGLAVRLEVEQLSSDVDGGHLLMIVVHPLPAFVHLASSTKVAQELQDGNIYHISLCFAAEMREDDWRRYERIRTRFDGRIGRLSVDVTNSAANLNVDHRLSRQVLENADILDLHSIGSYRGRPIHVSL